MKKIPKSRFWSGLKSSINTELNDKKRVQKRAYDQDPNLRAKLRAEAQIKRKNKQLKNIELKSRGG